MRLISKLFYCSALFMAMAAQAETEPHSRAVPETSGWEFGLSAGQTWLDSEAAAQAAIDDRAELFLLNVQYYFAATPWMINFGGGSLGYDDYSGFSQTVQEQYSGDTYSKDSSASGTILFIEGGANYPINTALFVQGRLGLSSVFGSSRNIDNCDNCYEEDFDIGGGAYGALTFGGTIADTVEVSLQYHYYLSGDLESSLSLNVGSHFF